MRRHCTALRYVLLCHFEGCGQAATPRRCTVLPIEPLRPLSDEVEQHGAAGGTTVSVCTYQACHLAKLPLASPDETWLSSRSVRWLTLSTLRDIVAVHFGHPVDSETGFTRPAVVITADGCLRYRPSTIFVVPVTTTERTFPSHVEITSDTVNGLDETGWALVEQLCAVAVDRCGSSLGNVGPCCCAAALGDRGDADGHALAKHDLLRRRQRRRAHENNRLVGGSEVEEDPHLVGGESGQLASAGLDDGG